MPTVYYDVHQPTGQRKSGAPKWSDAKWTNGKKQSRNAYPGEGTAPLSRAQIAKLCIRAKAAFEHTLGYAPTSTAELDAWRHEEQRKKVGQASLTTCTAGDYLPLLAHFAELAGESGEAYNAHIKDQTAEVRVAVHKLEEACQQAGKPLSYAAAIGRSKFKSGLDKLTSKQVWQLVFDMRKRKAETGKRKAEDPLRQAQGLEPAETAEPLDGPDIPF